MEFSCEWLGEYLDLSDVGIEELAQGLTDVGLAVELIEEKDGDTVFDLDVTTNRPDCMNHFGVAREIGVILGRSLTQPSIDLEFGGANGHELISIEAPETCRRYVGLVLEGVEIKESPLWMRRRLEAIGLRPINNVVDVTNYVLWELGQPLHAFDLDTLSDQRVVVRFAKEGESLRTLDGEDRELSTDMLVIADSERPIALAGIMGGEATEVTAATHRILLESAWFEPGSVRRTARQLGMHTDASHRFERIADIEACQRATERAAVLILELGGGSVVGPPIDGRGESFGPLQAVVLAHSKLERFAGIQIPREEVEGKLAALGFQLESTEQGWNVKSPSWRRFDVVEPADLYEEVLRTIGFDRIPAIVPPSDGPDAPELPVHYLRRKVRHQLASSGYSEAINYAFYGEPEDSIVDPLVGGSVVEVLNPLSDRYCWMRRNLLAGVVANARFNRRRNAEVVRLFEIGHVFWKNGEEDVSEAEHLSIVLGGQLGTPWEGQVAMDLFDLKGVVESLGTLTGVEIVAESSSRSGLVPGIAAQLLVRDEVVGFLGELDEASGEAFPLYVVELCLDSLLPVAGPRTIKIPSRFPGVGIDLTLTHSLTVPFAEISAAIEKAAVEGLVGHYLKDRYQGKGVPEGCVNTTLHFEYNAKNRSLTQNEVNERQADLSAKLKEQFGSGGE